MSDTPANDDDPEFDAKLEQYRQRTAARRAEIKDGLMAWLEPRDSAADNVCITMALFELAFDRHIAIHEADGFDLIEADYRRALKRWRGALQ